MRQAISQSVNLRYQRRIKSNFFNFLKISYLVEKFKIYQFLKILILSLKRGKFLRSLHQSRNVLIGFLLHLRDAVATVFFYWSWWRCQSGKKSHRQDPCLALRLSINCWAALLCLPFSSPSSVWPFLSSFFMLSLAGWITLHINTNSYKFTSVFTLNLLMQHANSLQIVSILPIRAWITDSQNSVKWLASIWFENSLDKCEVETHLCKQTPMPRKISSHFWLEFWCLMFIFSQLLWDLEIMSEI